MKRKPRGDPERARRRAGERAQEKVSRARERLFFLETGGSPERPIEVVSSAVVDAHAVSVPCPSCGGAHELVEHAAVTVAGTRLREARLRCRQCGTRRSLWFRLVGEGVN